MTGPVQTPSSGTSTGPRDGSSGRPLVLACLIDDLGTGGAQRIVSVMARELARHDVRLVVVSLGTRDAERASLIERGAEVHVLPAPNILSPGRLARLVSLLRSIRPDIVHTHLLTSHVLGAIVARALRVPLVATLHNVDPHPRFAGTWKRRAETLCLRFAASRLIAVGPAVRASNARRLGARRIDVLANPLPASMTELSGGAGEEAERTLGRLRDEARGRVAALIGSTADTRHVLTVGRLSSEKGWPGFLDVFEELGRAHPNCKLVAVGDGPCLEPLRRDIAARGLGERVHLLGRRDDVHTFYLGSDVFVLNSDIEGLPMALLEAMSSGLPVVGTRVGDVEYAAEDDVARLVAPGRVDEMVDALSRTLARPSEASRLGLEGRRRVLERFDVERWTRELVAMYRDSARPFDGGRGSRRRASAAPVRTSAVGMGAAPPLHVMEFIDGIKTGGAQSLLALRARHARRMGYRLEIVSLGRHDVVPEALAGDVDAIHTFPSRHLFDRRRILEICALLRRSRPDVIHTHLRSSNTLGALCGRLCGIPVVSTLHNTFPELGQAHARRDWAERWALRLGAGSVMAVGPVVADTHRPRLGGKRIETIPNPVEPPEDHLDPDERKARARASLDLPFDAAGSHIVLAVGRLTRAKGLLDSVQAIARLGPRFPALRFLVAGDGKLHDELARLVETSGLGDTVFLLGRSERVRELMAASDVLLLSSHAEGLPLVVLEAMSMHLPVVATRVGDVPWLLGDGELGRLVEPGDVPGTALAVEELLDAPGEARAMAERAHARVRDAFSVGRWLGDVDRVLRRAGGAGGGAAAKRRKLATSPDFAVEDADGPRDPLARLK